MVVFQINYPATEHIYLLLTGDERQREGVRVIMARFYWLANRNSLQAATELKAAVGERTTEASCRSIYSRCPAEHCCGWSVRRQRGVRN